jgi:hypothetical protein
MQLEVEYAAKLRAIGLPAQHVDSMQFWHSLPYVIST